MLFLFGWVLRQRDHSRRCKLMTNGLRGAIPCTTNSTRSSAKHVLAGEKITFLMSAKARRHQQVASPRIIPNPLYLAKPVPLERGHSEPCGQKGRELNVSKGLAWRIWHSHGLIVARVLFFRSHDASTPSAASTSARASARACAAKCPEAAAGGVGRAARGTGGDAQGTAPGGRGFAAEDPRDHRCQDPRALRCRGQGEGRAAAGQRSSYRQAAARAQ